MPLYTKGSVQSMEDLGENLLKAIGFVCVHDGSKDGGQRYTKDYQLKLDGQLLRARISIMYDLGANRAVMSTAIPELQGLRDTLLQAETDRTHPKTTKWWQLWRRGNVKV